MKLNPSSRPSYDLQRNEHKTIIVAKTLQVFGDNQQVKQAYTYGVFDYLSSDELSNLAVEKRQSVKRSEHN